MTARHSEVTKDGVNLFPILDLGQEYTSFVDVLHHGIQNRRGSLREDEDRIFLEKRNGTIQQIVTEWQHDGLVNLNRAGEILENAKQKNRKF